MLRRHRIPDSLKRAIREEGFSLEHKVLKAFEKWNITPNRYFWDRSTGRISEYDLLAVKEYKNSNGLVFKLALAVECKYLKGITVFYERHLVNNEYPIMVRIGDKIKERFLMGDISKIINSLAQYKGMFFSENQVFGYASFKESNKNQSNQTAGGGGRGTENVYDSDDRTYKNLLAGIKGIAMAARYELEKITQEKSKEKSLLGNADLLLIFPLVVVEGKLLRCFMAKRTRISMDKVFRYRAAIPKMGGEEPSEFYVYIIDKDSLRTMLRFFNQLFIKMRGTFVKI